MTRVALVTGGARGLGKAIGERLVGDGWRVVLADVDGDAAAAAADGLGADASAVGLDVTDAAAVAATFDAVHERHGRLDALVCSAAVEVRARLGETSDDDWQRVLDVNLKGPFLCMRAGIPRIVGSGGGSVVLLGSTLGALGAPGYAAYCASKGALVNLAKQAAIEHAREQVRVNVVAPSACDTGLFMGVAAASGDPDRVIAMVTGTNPMGRLGRAEEVAATVAFLCSDGAAYLSGAVLPLDGALAARRT